MEDNEKSGFRSLSPRMLAEFLVIALGVFMALAADAAWNSRTDRIVEAGYLGALQVELGAAAEELAEDHAIREMMLAGGDSLAAEFVMRSAADSAVIFWIERLVLRLRKFAPPSAVLDELVSSGNLGLLRSTELRFGLMEYQRERARLAWLEDRVLATTEGALIPHLQEQVPWLAPVSAAFPRSPTLPLSAVRVLLEDEVFRNKILLKSNRLSLLQRRSSGLLEELARLMVLVERELE